MNDRPHSDDAVRWSISQCHCKEVPRYSYFADRLMKLQENSRLTKEVPL